MIRCLMFVDSVHFLTRFRDSPLLMFCISCLVVHFGLVCISDSGMMAWLIIMMAAGVFGMDDVPLASRYRCPVLSVLSRPVPGNKTSGSNRCLAACPSCLVCFVRIEQKTCTEQKTHCFWNVCFALGMVVLSPVQMNHGQDRTDRETTDEWKERHKDRL